MLGRCFPWAAHRAVRLVAPAGREGTRVQSAGQLQWGSGWGFLACSTPQSTSSLGCVGTGPAIWRPWPGQGRDDAGFPCIHRGAGVAEGKGGGPVDCHEALASSGHTALENVRGEGRHTCGADDQVTRAMNARGLSVTCARAGSACPESHICVRGQARGHPGTLTCGQGSLSDPGRCCVW